MKSSKIIAAVIISLIIQAKNQADIYGQEILDDYGSVFEESRKGKMYLLPEVSIWFGTITNIELAPQLAYHLSDRLSVGLGPHYIFYKSVEYYNPEVFTTNIWGVKLFSRYILVKEAGDLLPIYLFDELFIHAEYERMSLENQYFNAPYYPDEGRFWLDSYYLGAGICQNFSANGSYYLMVLWNMNESWNSFYSNPVYRIGLDLYF